MKKPHLTMKAMILRLDYAEALLTSAGMSTLKASPPDGSDR